MRDLTIARENPNPKHRPLRHAVTNGEGSCCVLLRDRYSTLIVHQLNARKSIARSPYSRDCINLTIPVFPVARIDKEVLYIQTFVVVVQI